MNFKTKVRFIVLQVTFLLTSCKYFAVAIANETVPADNLIFSCQSASNLPEEIIGEVQCVDLNYYNHSPAHYYFYESLSPKKIDVGIVTYFSYVVHGSGDMGDQAYGEEFLQWQMNLETFSQEKSRLLSIFNYDTGKGTVVSLDLFFAPSCVAIYNFDSKFSYAIFEEEKLTITYIYFYNIKQVSNLVFDEKFKPSKKLNDSDFSGNIMRGSYNINIYYGEMGK